jgi:purine-binding chemotaxis protein CheW
MSTHTTTADSATKTCDFVTFKVKDQQFGLKAIEVRDVLRSPRITHIPLASREISGVINLRGHIVTAIDVRRRLGLSDRNVGDPTMSIVVERNGEQFCLITDGVGDVLAVDQAAIEPTPASVDAEWRAVASGIHKLKDTLVVLVDLQRLLTLEH